MSILRRRTIAEAREGTARAAVEDDFHLMDVCLEHDGSVVTRLSGQIRRYPWTTCPFAEAKLADLRGARLGPRPATEVAGFNPKSHCTHLFDLACFAIAQAWRGGRREYDIAVPDRIDGCTRAEIRRDGVLVLGWDMDGDLIVSGRDAGQNARQISSRGQAFDDDAFEAMMMLRRGLMISRGRRDRSRPLAATAAERLSRLSGACFTYQPETAPKSRRSIHTPSDFTHCPEKLLADFDASANK
jgi:hypothetical protein